MSWSKNRPGREGVPVGVLRELPGRRCGRPKGTTSRLLKEFRTKPMPILGEDPRLTILQDFDQAARVVGHPGPPTPAAAEVEQNWIIPLMMGRAVQTGNANEAVDWAAAKVDAIYARYR